MPCKKRLTTGSVLGTIEGQRLNILTAPHWGGSIQHPIAECEKRRMLNLMANLVGWVTNPFSSTANLIFWTNY